MAEEAKLGSLKKKDFFKGLLTAVGTTILIGGYALLTANPVVLSIAVLKPSLIAGAASGVAYLLKNLGTDENDKFLGIGSPKE